MQLHSELWSVGFTLPLGASSFLLDKKNPAENDPIFWCGNCVCVCVSELVQSQRSVAVDHCALRNLWHVHSQNLWWVGLFCFPVCSWSCVLSIHVISLSILVMNCLCCSSQFLPKMSSSPPLFLVISDEIWVPASGSTMRISGEVLQAHQCSSLSIMPKILFTTLSCVLNVANVVLKCLLREQGIAQKLQEEVRCAWTHKCF